MEGTLENAPSRRKQGRSPANRQQRRVSGMKTSSPSPASPKNTKLSKLKTGARRPAASPQSRKATSKATGSGRPTLNNSSKTTKHKQTATSARSKAASKKLYNYLNPTGRTTTFVSSPAAAAMGAALKAELIAASAAFKQKGKNGGPTAADRRVKHNATERYRTFLISEKVAEIGAYMTSLGRSFKNEKLHILTAAVTLFEELLAEESALKETAAKPKTEQVEGLGQTPHLHQQPQVKQVKQEPPPNAIATSPTDVLVHPGLNTMALRDLTARSLYRHFPAPRAFFDDQGRIISHNALFHTVFCQGRGSAGQCSPASASASSQPSLTHIAKICCCGRGATIPGGPGGPGSAPVNHKVAVWASVVRRLRERNPAQKQVVEQVKSQSAKPKGCGCNGKPCHREEAAGGHKCACHHLVLQDTVVTKNRTSLVFEAWVSRVALGAGKHIFQALFVHLSETPNAVHGTHGCGCGGPPKRHHDAMASGSGGGAGDPDGTSLATTRLPHWIRGSEFPVILAPCHSFTIKHHSGQIHRVNNPHEATARAARGPFGSFVASEPYLG